MSRRPNSGPYVVSWAGKFGGAVSSREFQLWADACSFMRVLLVEGYVPSVAFS